MKIIGLLTFTLFLSGCVTYTDSAHQVAYDKAAALDHQVDSGNIKESRACFKKIDFVADTPRIGPAKAEIMRAALVRCRAVRAFEDGKITKQKLQDIKYEFKIRIAELDNVTDEWIRNNRQRNANNWARGMGIYNDYLKSIQPPQREWTKISCVEIAPGHVDCTRR